MAEQLADESSHGGKPGADFGRGVQAGDITGTGIAIGHGAQAIVNNIRQYIQERLPAEQWEAEEKLSQRRLGQAILDRLEDYRRLQYISVPPGFNPYRSLLNYRIEDAAYYWREQAIADLRRTMLRAPLTVLHSVSGAGKSSLLQAGLASRLLADGHLPVYIEHYEGQSTALAIKKELLDEIGTYPDLARLENKSLKGFLLDVYRQLPPDKSLYLFLDQFETIFERHTLDEQRAFGRELSDCLSATGLKIYWVVALRTQYVYHLDLMFDRSVRKFLDNRCPLLPFDENEARTVIEEPARLQNVAYEAGLVDQILTDARDEDGRWQPPEIQLACYSLFEEARLEPNPQMISRSLYQRKRGGDRPGVEGILRDHLRQVVAEMPSPQQDLAWHLLYALVAPRRQPDEDARDELKIARRVRNSTDMKAEVERELGAVDDDLVEEVLERLESKRLLRVDRDRTAGDSGSYELAHDYLLKEIALPERLAARKLAQDVFEQSLLAYIQRRKLLDDSDLKLIDSWWSELVIREEDRIFAEQLREESKQARLRRTAIRAGVIIVGVSLVIAAAILSLGLLSARQAADNALATVVAAQATSTVVTLAQSRAEERAAMAAAQADQAESRAQAANAALQDAFAKSGIIPVGKSPAAMLFADTTLWVVTEAGNTVEALDPHTGLSRLTITAAGSPAAIIQADGRLWIANRQADVVQVIHPQTGDIEETIPVVKEPFALAYAGDQVWVASQFDGTIQAINPATYTTGQPIITGNRITAMISDGRYIWFGALNSVHGGSIGRLNPAGESIIDGPWELPVPIDLTFDGTDIWVLSCCQTGRPEVWLLDPETSMPGRRPIELELTTPSALLAAGDLLWVTDEETGLLQAIDPRLGETSQLFPVGPKPGALAYDGQDLWVSNRGNDTVQRVILREPAIFGPITPGNDTEAAAPGQPVCLDGGPVAVAPLVEPDTGGVSAATIREFGDWACDGQRLWRATADSLEIVDAATGQVRGVLPMAEDFAGSAAFDGEHLWITAYVYREEVAGNMGPVVGYVGALQWIDADGGELLDSYEYSGLVIPVGLVYDGRWLWLASAGEGTNGLLLQIEPLSAEIVNTLPLNIDPAAMIYDGRGLWLAEGQGEAVQYVVPPD